MSSPSKHILLLGPAYPYRGGLAAFNERLAYALQDAGHQVTLITFTLQYPDFLFPGKTQYSEDAAPEGLAIERKINAVNPFNWWRVGRELRKRRPDVVIAAYWMPFMAPCLGTILRQLDDRHTQRIGLVHNIIPHERRPGDQLLSRYFTAASDGFMTLSTSVKEELADFSAAPVRTSPHPIYDSYGARVNPTVARQHLGLDADGRYLLFFGYIREYKGLELLLEAMANPMIRKSGVKLILAGEYYGNQEKYETLMETLGITDLVIAHTSFIANDEVRYYFGAADLVVQPYKTATQSGISQLAYHFEKPMVVTRVGGLPEIVPHGEAGYVIEQDAEELAVSVLDFYQNERTESLGKGVRKEKQRFSWSTFVETLEQLF
ncbi:glycosyltransferase [Lewinella cohaerens]|uniref:glycosyltransferase n=1 Tax=Lewinella cohaerens TaxID=70995 RepID=UPI00037C6F38|nr:glycosyltransferase [Lewinella cohaerens]